MLQLYESHLHTSVSDHAFYYQLTVHQPQLHKSKQTQSLATIHSLWYTPCPHPLCWTVAWVKTAMFSRPWSALSGAPWWLLGPPPLCLSSPSAPSHDLLSLKHTAGLHWTAYCMQPVTIRHTLNGSMSFTIPWVYLIIIRM